jgi:hypothetical protein
VNPLLLAERLCRGLQLTVGQLAELRAIAHHHYTVSARAPRGDVEQEAYVMRRVREMLDGEQRRTFDANVEAWRAERGRE